MALTQAPLQKADKSLASTLQLQQVGNPFRRVLVVLLTDVVLVLVPITDHFPIAIRQLNLVPVMGKNVVLVNDGLVLRKVAEILLTMWGGVCGRVG